MRNMRTLALISLFGLALYLTCRADDNEKNGNVLIPPGMETIREGDVAVVVPKGGMLRKQGSVMLIETADEYAARKFLDVESQFKALQEAFEEQKNELEAQKKKLKYMGKNMEKLMREKNDH